MPLLQSIVQEFDQELKRLHALRKIVAGLNHSPARIRLFTEAAVDQALVVKAPPTKADTAKPRRTVRRDAGMGRGSSGLKHTHQTRALANKVPSGPVVFYPKRSLQMQSADAALAVPQQTSTAAPVDLDAESLKLAALWTASSLN